MFKMKRINFQVVRRKTVVLCQWKVVYARETLSNRSFYHMYG